MSEKVTLGDTRLKKDAADQARGDRSHADLGRESTDGTILNKMEQYKQNFRNEWAANALPEPPAIPGFHLCWLSTNNSYDPIYKRIRLGYEPVKASEMPEFETYKMNAGEYEGMVGCNEMVLFKLPMELYQYYMQQFHHDRPLEEENMLKHNPAVQDKNAIRIAEEEEDGFEALARKVDRAPKFV